MMSLKDIEKEKFNFYMKRQPRTFVTGDTHILKDFKHLHALCNVYEKNLNKDDVVIICGDVGLTWDRNTCCNLLNIFAYQNLPCTVVIVDGNHENFDTLYKYPVVEKFGNTAYQISSSVFYLRRGNIYKINGQTFFVFGGGDSVGKLTSIPHKDWWKEEAPSPLEFRTGFTFLELCNWEVDYIITHSCGFKDLEQLEEKIQVFYCKDPDNPDLFLKKFIDEIKEKTNFKHHYCGHYHQDVTINEKTTFLFKGYKEITDYK